MDPEEEIVLIGGLIEVLEATLRRYHEINFHSEAWHLERAVSELNATRELLKHEGGQ